jgi:hypothetical protein
MTAPRLIAALMALAGASWLAPPAFAYTAAGDRIFPATLLMPQVAPSDDVYGTVATQPGSGGNTRQTDLTGVYGKTLTERFGIAIEGAYSWIDRAGGGSVSGPQQVEIQLRYLVIQDLPREFLLTFGLNQDIGSSGSPRVGADTQGGTTPWLYMAKGLGDLEPKYLRPFAVLGAIGFEKSNGDPRPDRLRTGIAVQYSLPYLQSKVAALDLPPFFAAMSPMVEYFRTEAVSLSRGNPTTATVAPGVIYAGEGWEFGIEALVPTTRATGTGPGVIAQFHLSLDFFFPQSIGRPLFGGQ